MKVQIYNKENTICIRMHQKVSTCIRKILPSYNPSVFHGRILYYTLFTIQMTFTAECYMLVTRDR